MVRAQSLKNVVINYLGFALGGLNYIILMPRLLEPLEIGLIRIVISAASLLMIFVSFGGNVTLLKIFPDYKHSVRRSRALMTWLYLLFFAACIAASGLYAALRPVISDYYAQKSPLFNVYYYSVIPLSIAMAGSVCWN